MFRRLLMTLLIACLAAPAMAMPAHCGPAPALAQVHGDHHAPEAGSDEDQPSAPIKRMDCIGCIAPSAGTAQVGQIDGHGLPPLRVRQARFEPPCHSSPDTPPPRS